MMLALYMDNTEEAYTKNWSPPEAVSIAIIEHIQFNCNFYKC